MPRRLRPMRRWPRSSRASRWRRTGPPLRRGKRGQRRRAEREPGWRERRRTGTVAGHAHRDGAGRTRRERRATPSLDRGGWSPRADVDPRHLPTHGGLSRQYDRARRHARCRWAMVAPIWAIRTTTSSTAAGRGSSLALGDASGGARKPPRPRPALAGAVPVVAAPAASDRGHQGSGAIEHFAGHRRHQLYAYFPLSEVGHRTGKFGEQEFVFDAATDTSRCPGDGTLRFLSQWPDAPERGGRTRRAASHDHDIHFRTRNLAHAASAVAGDAPRCDSVSKECT